MRAAVRVGATVFDLDLANPVDLSRAIEFPSVKLGPPQPFGAPAPTAAALRVGRFVGDVGRGGSCNCATINLTPHTSGTHTEAVGHLTRGRLDAWRVVPGGFLPCLLLRIEVAARAGERIVTAAALEAAWPPAPAFAPLAVVIASGFVGTGDDLLDPPWLAPAAAAFLVARGIEHLVVDLPSLDRREDGGALAAHRVFFGLPAGSVELRDARRTAATVTELASIPAAVPGGSYFLALQVPAIAGDAVPSRPLLYAIAAASTASPARVP